MLSDGEIDRMRQDLMSAAPVLLAEGWSTEEIRSIGPGVKEALAGNDLSLVHCWQSWLSEKARLADMADGVVPVLSLAAETRLMDKAWNQGMQAK